jgi:iron(III) transport system ATP-binding protein
MAEVRLENIFKSYEKHAVHEDLNLTINDGECFVVLGPSGCGKTVLLRLLRGLKNRTQVKSTWTTS